MSIASENDRISVPGVPLERKTSGIQLEAIGHIDDDGAERPHKFSAEEEKRLWRKVDLRLMPILSAMYLLSFMDRVYRFNCIGNIGNARIEGLTKQLHLIGDRYNIALTMFFVSYCTFECPANLALKVFRPSRWLPGIMVLWGIVMMSMGFVKTYPGLVGARFCLGLAEAGLFPGVVYYLTLWYPRHMLQYRVGLFFGAATIAGAFSGLFAFGIGYMNGVDHLEGWSWIFIIEGILTVVVAIVAFFLIVDFPSTATFLTPEERAYLEWKKKYDSSSVGEEEHFALRHILAPFLDWQVYLHILVYMSIVAPLYGITLFLPTIINSFGHSTPISQLLTVPPYIVATIVLLTFAHYSDKLKIRSLFIYAGLLLLLIGYAINISDASDNVKYFGTFLIVIGSYASFPGVVAWLGNNLTGQYKRAVGMAFQIGIGNFSGAISANIYLSKDAPRFIFGHGLELMFVAIGLVVVPILAISYQRINSARDAAERRRVERGEKLELTAQKSRELGDRAPDFRYTL